MGNEEAKVYMPTFNKNKDSLASDVNGTYQGTVAGDKAYYDDYVTYALENGAVVDVNAKTVDGAVIENIPEKGSALTEANKDVTTVTNMVIYDDDTDALAV